MITNPFNQFNLIFAADRFVCISLIALHYDAGRSHSEHGPLEATRHTFVSYVAMVTCEVCGRLAVWLCRLLLCCYTGLRPTGCAWRPSVH